MSGLRFDRGRRVAGDASVVEHAVEFRLFLDGQCPEFGRELADTLTGKQAEELFHCTSESHWKPLCETVLRAILNSRS